MKWPFEAERSALMNGIAQTPEQPFELRNNDSDLQKTLTASTAWWHHLGYLLPLSCKRPAAVWAGRVVFDSAFDQDVDIWWSFAWIAEALVDEVSQSRVSQESQSVDDHKLTPPGSTWSFPFT